MKSREEEKVDRPGDNERMKGLEIFVNSKSMCSKSSYLNMRGLGAQGKKRFNLLICSNDKTYGVTER